MSRKALKVVVEIKFRAVSCPGVHLASREDLYLSVCFMGQYRQSERLPAVFPLLLHEKMTFEKIFRHAVDPGDIAVLLEHETVRTELVQLAPPVGDALACFEEDARRFLFPEPKLVPTFSGVDREVLMTRAPYFPGIAPRLEFSTKTTIIECSADAGINIHPDVNVRPVVKRNRKRSSSPQRRRLRHPASSSQRLARLNQADWDTTSTFPTMLASWPGTSKSSTPHRHSEASTNAASALTRSSSTGRFSPSDRRRDLTSGLIGGVFEDAPPSAETHDPLENQQVSEPSGLWGYNRERVGHSRSQSCSHKEWEIIHDRVRGLLTTPKAVRRLVYGATHSEVDEILARRSISPGPS
ncbi:spermatogenesis associated 6-like protein [Aulostomus maculatus]